LEFPCPVCLINPDDALVGGKVSGMCSECGQTICGECNAQDRVGRLACCPTCRASIAVSDSTYFTRCTKLVYGRSVGRHTPRAQSALATLYNDGKGVKEDKQEAVRLWRLAAAGGSDQAAYNLAVITQHGKGVPQSYTEALRLFKQTSDRGFAPGQCNIGYLYENGLGTKQDLTKALGFYKLSADQGHSAAQWNLGSLLKEGRGVPVNVELARKYWTLAAKQGHCEAQAHLGGILINTDRDFTRALFWFQQAGQQGNEQALSMVHDLQARELIAQPIPGCAVLIILLTSAAGMKNNNRVGHVLPRTKDVKPGRAAVMLQGETKAMSFKLMNLWIIPHVTDAKVGDIVQLVKGNNASRTVGDYRVVATNN